MYLNIKIIRYNVILGSGELDSIPYSATLKFCDVGYI